MRYHEIITEATIDNMAILGDVADIILSQLEKNLSSDSGGKYFPEDERIYITHEYIDTEIQKLKSKYKDAKYQSSLDVLEKSVRTVFDNGRGVNAIGIGTYYWPNTIYVNVYHYTGGDKEYFDTLMKANIADHPNDTISWYKIKSVLIHELRHLFQAHQFHDFFAKNAGWKDYNTKFIELDAAWVGFLEAYPPSKMTSSKSAATYARVIMGKFANYKTLTDRQTKDYYRKTVRYFVDFHNKQYEQERPSDTPAGRREQARDWIRNNIRIAVTTPLIEYDLRTLPGYNPEANNLLLPVDRVSAIVKRVVDPQQVNNLTPNTFQKNMIFFLPALLDHKHMVFWKSKIVQYMKSMYNYTPDDAINSMSDGFPEGFDFKAMGDLIRRTYQ